MNQMLVIPEETVVKSIDMKTALVAARDAYMASAKGEMIQVGRLALPVSGEKNMGQWLVALCTKLPYFGSKMASVFPGNPANGLPSIHAKISLYSNVTGQQLALIDAGFLTDVKTGAAAGVATDLMARPDACTLGLIGTGAQAVTQLQAIQEVRRLDKVYLYDRSPERAAAFREKALAMANRPYEVILCDSADQCAASVGILSVATPSTTPVFDGKVLRPGTHVNAVGSFAPTMQEVDEETVLRSDRIITEHVDGLWAAAGDILIPFNKGLITKEKVNGSVGDVLVGNIPARQSAEEITMFESVGSCVLDVAMAIAVYDGVKG